jgi:ribosomal protein RSM22 (predicted rRNA methylase)
VEPGSRDISRRLTSARDRLRERGHHPVAPCTHGLACPMNGRERDWCHFFAAPPPEIFQSAFWREFSTRLEIDLRALPYSFLATSRQPVRWPEGAERVIGRPRGLKAHCELLCCGADGLVTRTLQKRDAPKLFRAFTRDGHDGAFVWTADAARPGRVTDGQETALP